MLIETLSKMPAKRTLKADLVIVGGGPVGITIARHCAAPGRRILIVESGLECEDEEHNNLIKKENIGELNARPQVEARVRFHQVMAKLWRQEDQPFGVATRGLGGSTQAWAGKSAPFDAIDFERRPWVAFSDWPVAYEEAKSYTERAMAHLDLCPHTLANQIDAPGLKSFFWQFARSRSKQADVMHFGEELLKDRPDNIDVLLDATVTHIALNDAGTRFDHLDVSSLSGVTARIEADYCVLAANAIENPRLLLVSNDVHADGIGNAHGNVGRYLADHAFTTVGTFNADEASKPAQRFGFFSVSRNRRSHIFLHGLALTPEIQREEKLLNASVYFAPELALDDPSEAFKRLIRLQSKECGKDLLRVIKDGATLVKAMGVKLVQHPRVPDWLRNFIVNIAIRLHPNLVAEEFISQGVPHKLASLEIKAITEQVPNRDSRVSLSDQRDALGIPRAKVDWRIGDLERTTLLRLTELVRDGLAKAGMPAPILADWVNQRRVDDAVIIDMGHTVGTTRMSCDPRFGVVDAHCRVHGLENLYVSGGSVFPTAGHTNPTLMFLAFAIRLADHLNGRFDGCEPPASGQVGRDASHSTAQLEVTE